MTETTAETIKARLAQCHQAFAAGRSRDLAWRNGQLLALENMLKAHETEFSAALHADMGKPEPEAWLTEISFLLSASKFTRKHLRRWAKDQRVATAMIAQPGNSWIHSEPLGTVLIIAPWNYPLQLCLAPLITAIAAGNCAFIKPSELAPATSALLAELLPRYLDNECVVVAEGGVATSTALLAEAWDHIVFTGGDRVAKVVMRAAAEHLTPVTLELGGKSPCIVLPDANLEVTARRIAWGKFINAGQTCIAPDYLMMDAATLALFVPLLKKELNNMFGADPATSKDLARIINQTHFERLLALLADQNILAGGQHDRATRFIAPTVVGPVNDQSPIMQGEIFGPLLPILEVPDLDAAIAQIKRGPKPLAAYLFSSSSDAQQKLSEQVSSGSLCINDVLLFMAMDELPFGGVGNSGMGTYAGHEGFRQMSHEKAVLKRSWWPDWRIRYAPFTQKKMKWLRKL